MVNVICQLIIMARSREGREFRAPTLASLENCLKLSQMAVQGLRQFRSLCCSSPTSRRTTSEGSPIIKSTKLKLSRPW
ncbi:Translocation Protein Sec63 [Manis pentadactyla]|nr:Translocation Protein Sec63 [Manis pentadactyla]